MKIYSIASEADLHHLLTYFALPKLKTMCWVCETLLQYVFLCVNQYENVI